MKQIFIFFFSFIFLTLVACNPKTQNEKEGNESETIETTVITNTVNPEDMNTETLGTEMGKICAESLDFVYNELKSNPQIDDKIKQRFSEKRKDIFTRYIPLLNQLNQLDEEAAGECRMHAGIGVIENLEVDMEEMGAVLDEVFNGFMENEQDENFLMDVQALYLAMEFLSMDELKEQAPELLEHVGL